MQKTNTQTMRSHFTYSISDYPRNSTMHWMPWDTWLQPSISWHPVHGWVTWVITNTVCKMWSHSLCICFLHVYSVLYLACMLCTSLISLMLVSYFAIIQALYWNSTISICTHVYTQHQTNALYWDLPNFLIY